MNSICKYLYRDGRVCNKRCVRPEGCRVHYKSPKKVPCLACDKPTCSQSGFCSDHNNTAKCKAYRDRKKQQADAADAIDEILAWISGNDVARVFTDENNVSEE